MRSILFRIHWFIGITAGLVLLVVGATGAILAVQPEVQDALNRTHRLDASGALAPPARWIEGVAAANPGHQVQKVLVRRQRNGLDEHSIARGPAE